MTKLNILKKDTLTYFQHTLLFIIIISQHTIAILIELKKINN